MNVRAEEVIKIGWFTIAMGAAIVALGVLRFEAHPVAAAILSLNGLVLACVGTWKLTQAYHHIEYSKQEDFTFEPSEEDKLLYAEVDEMMNARITHDKAIDKLKSAMSNDDIEAISSALDTLACKLAEEYGDTEIAKSLLRTANKLLTHYPDDIKIAIKSDPYN